MSARAECAADSILNGVAAIGKLMFYAGGITGQTMMSDAVNVLAFTTLARVRAGWTECAR